jgi:hypothetical protein
MDEIGMEVILDSLDRSLHQWVLLGPSQGAPGQVVHHPVHGDAIDLLGVLAAVNAAGIPGGRKDFHLPTALAQFHGEPAGVDLCAAHFQGWISV